MATRDEVARAIIVNFIRRTSGDSEAAMSIALKLSKIWEIPVIGFETLPKLEDILPSEELQTAIQKDEGDVALGAGDCDAAIRILSEVVDPGDSTAILLKRSAAYIKHEKYEQAAADCRRILESDPENAVAHSQYVFALWCDGLTDEAKVAYERALVSCAGDGVIRDLVCLFGSSVTGH